MTESKLYFYRLSFLRFPLAIWVVFHHTFNADNILSFHNLPEPIQILSKTGSMAPTVFFILSGFVIHNCLMGGKTKFYYNRFITIIPLYLISTLIIFSSMQKDYSELVMNLLGLNTFTYGESWFSINGPAWSLSLEICFYLLAPFIFKIVNKLNTTFIVVIYLIQVISLLVVNQIWGAERAFHYTYHNLFYQLLNFTMGMFIGKFFHSQLKLKLRGTQPVRIKIFASTTFLLGVYFSGTISVEILKYGILVTPGAAFLIYTLACSETDPTKKMRVISKLGNSAFPIYIMHWIFIGYIRYFIGSSTSYFIYFYKFICICISLTLIGLIVNKYFINFLKFKMKFSFMNLVPLIIFSLSLVVTQNYSSFSSPNNFKSNVNLKASVFYDSESPNLRIENLSNKPTKINSCRIFIMKERDAYRMNGDFLMVDVPVNQVLSSKIGFLNFESEKLKPATLSQVKCN